MIRNRIFLKRLAIFLIIEVVASTVWPTVSYALTSGPTAPEATSFEPVDTTDMVNLATGDLAYNIPLLEVPGPAGGYPLSLSYHAGIMPNEEASWVGLGWTLNPGAINRSVNGFADDHNGVTNTSRFYWEGGSRSSLQIGVTQGISGVAGVSASIAIGHDTYQGFSAGGSVGLYVGAGSAGLRGSIGVQPFGGVYGSVGATIDHSVSKAISITANMSMSTNFKQTSYQSSLGIDAFNTVGASMSSLNGGSASISSSRGDMSVTNNKSGRISTTSTNITLPLPLLNLGFNYQRYWIDETDNVSTYGALYNPRLGGGSLSDAEAFDSYALLDPEKNIIDYPDPEKALGGSFIGYDQYDLSAQGLNGRIRPYLYKGLIYRQNRRVPGTSNYEVREHRYESLTPSPSMEFRFIGDFSNKYINSGGRFTVNTFMWYNPLVPSFENEEQTGLGPMYPNVYSLYGSRHIEWFTNAQIAGLDTQKRPGGLGFMDCNATGFVRGTSETLRDQIGGFMITNESGITYHFALPVYSHDEYQRTTNIDRADGTTFSELTKKDPYAFMWYLTGITGPDYVDRGPAGEPDGKLNKYDWGYWVEFEYGKWTDSFAWRNPGTGTNNDIDHKFKTFSEGLREVYYLDAIRTATHTAYFVKSIRDDAKSATYSFRNFEGNANNGSKKYKLTSVTKNGGFVPVEIENTCEIIGGIGIKDLGKIEYYSRPVSSLKLDTVFLIENNRLPQEVLDKSNGINYAQQYTYQWQVSTNNSSPGDMECDFSQMNVNQHFYQNVFDVYDLQNVNLRSNAVRIIALETSNVHLMPETDNSFEFSLVKPGTPQTDSNLIPRKAKLSLEGLHFLGKGGADLMPPVKFNYDIESPLTGYNSVTKPTNYEISEFKLGQNDLGLIEGDLVKLYNDNKVCYAFVISTGNDGSKIRIIGKSMPTVGDKYYWLMTKNPPFNKDFTDIWGMYKSDFIPGDEDETIRHVVTAQSARQSDVWSLRSVTTQTGAKIKFDYEGDVYDEVGVDFSKIFRVSGLVSTSDTKKLILADDVPNLNKLLIEGTTINCLLMLGHSYSVAPQPNYACYPAQISTQYDFAFESKEVALEIENVSYENSKWVIDVGQQLNSYFVARPSETNTYLYNLYFCNGSYLQQNQCNTTPVNCWINFTTTYNTPDLIAGNISVDGNFGNYGGGLRVKSVSIETDAEVSSTLYSYDAGVTTFEPFGMDQASYLYPSLQHYDNDDRKQRLSKKYEKLLYRKFSDLLVNAREIPAPGVLYGRVTVEEKVDNLFLPEVKEYQFQTFSYQDISFVTLSEDSTEHPNVLSGDMSNYKRTMRRDLVVRDKTSRVGSLLSVLTKERETGSKVSEIKNEYRSGIYTRQGEVQETFFDARYVREKDGSNSLIGIITRREYYPNVKISESETNFKTGVSTKKMNLEFDFYSGQVTKSSVQDAYGNTFYTEITPAYHKYPMMTFKGAGGSNMLTQEAGTYIYKNAINRALLTASVQTWSNSSLILNHDEALGPIMLLEVTQNSSFNYPQLPKVPTFSAKSSISNHLSEGDYVQFEWAGVEHLARVIDATLLQAQQQYSYQLMVVNNTLALQSAVSAIEAQRVLGTKKLATYSFIGDDNQELRQDGLYTLVNDQLPAFTAWNLGDPTPAGWQKNAEITLYDVYSHALEASDLNGQFAATKMTPDQTRVSATVANARYNEFTYSGAEEGATGSSLGNSVMLGTGATLSTSTAHTGSGAVKSSNQGFFTEAEVTPGKKYTISVWASKASATLKWVDGTGTTGTDVVLQLKRRAGNWYLLTGTVQPTQMHMKVWSQANGEETHFDDFRVHPFDAAMMSYVYNSWGELSHILDNNNLYSEYRYDAMGRLTSTYKETFMTPQEQARYGDNGIVKVSEVSYNYGANSPFMLPLTFTKSGSTGDIVYTGLPRVQQRKSFTFEIKENCSTPKFASLMIDNQLINTAISTHTLLDGTIVKVNGKVVTLENVISPHTIYVNFNDFSNTGWARCYLVPRINEFGNTVYCRDGSFEYWYFNACGEELTHHRVYNISEVPPELRTHLPAGGCALEQGTNCDGNEQQ